MSDDIKINDQYRGSRRNLRDIFLSGGDPTGVPKETTYMVADWNARSIEMMTVDDICERLTVE